jgi:hypothetical protein
MHRHVKLVPLAEPLKDEELGLKVETEAEKKLQDLLG